jgi:prepilin-type N-terminal cleavage/methylation domain-containing protein
VLEVEQMNKQKGFTLVELLVVITVIGILVALAVPNVTRLKTKAKETRVMGGAHEIQAALETFASNHDGLYPGLAVPAADNDANNGHTDPFFNSDPNLDSMRALIGGGPVKPEDPNLDFLDAFYFIPNPTVAVCPLQVPDRLVADGALTVYPENPFRTNMTNVTDQAIPMLNIFGIEFPRGSLNPGANDLFAGDPAPVVLSEPLWFGLDNNAKAPDSPPGAYYFAVPGPDFRYRGDANSAPNAGNFLRYDPNQDWKIERGDLVSAGFPEGNFAYIPLDPVQTDPTAPDFMRYCRHYWLVMYGSTDSGLRNRYKDVVPNFPRPLGDGQPDNMTDLSKLTAYEKTVKMALVGAMEVIATNYQDQLRVEGS